jgi:hypothetical protein
LGLFVTVGIGLAHAQITGVKLPVPFEFQVVDQTFAPGMYDFVQETPNVKLAIRSKKGKDGLFATTNLPTKSLSESDATWLIFHRFKDKYFLSEIWSKRLGVQFPVGAEEKRMRESGVEELRVRMNVK